MFGNWIDKIVRKTINEITISTENKFEEFHKRFRTIESLEQEISKLKIAMSVEEEKFSRREREVTHKLGLERMRQEQDNEIYKKKFELDVREQNISASEKRFNEQMEFQRKHLEEKISSLNVLVEKVFEKIPQVSHQTKVIERRTTSNELKSEN